MSSSKKAYSLKPELVPGQKAKSAEQSAFRHELNQSQWEAVSNTEGPQLVPVKRVPWYIEWHT